MPRHVDQPVDLGALPKLFDGKTTARLIKVGHNKWIDECRDQIEHVMIGHRRFYTEQAILDYLKRNTRKPAAADPRSRGRVPAKPVPPPKGRCKDGRQRRAQEAAHG
jgi:hypothetical protein